MQRVDLLPALLRIARSVTDDDELSFAADTAFADIEDWDSLNHIHIVVAMEQTFGIRFADPARLQSVVKVQDLLDIVAELKGI